MGKKSDRSYICARAAVRKSSFISNTILAIVAASALAFIGPRASAADWFVDGTFGNDANSCSSTVFACRTIQAAVDKAFAGDTIHVTFGTYPEPAPGPLTINKQLTLLGNQAGVDARTRAGLESIVTDPQGTSVSADGVILAGFTFQGSVSAFPGFGIWLNPGVGGTVIIENIIQNNIVGIGLANDGAQAFIRFNLIRNNNVPGSASGTGIYTDQFVGGSVIRNVIIDSNAFVGNNDAGIDSSNTDPSGGVYDVEVSNNSFNANGRAVVLFNTHNWVIRDNSIPNSTLPGSASVRIFDNNSNLAIGDNDILTGAFHAIRLSFLGIVG
ncbi:MAG TPA: hypothetical protein VK615_13345, partial [Candidatus Binatia bacterium]|nr:hypothetical protein [Candidatus Binatia bacterium]